MLNHLVSVLVWLGVTIAVFHLFDIDAAFFLSSAGFIGAGVASIGVAGTEPSRGIALSLLLFGALCALPTILALWWAPALVVFQDASTATALAASLRAALANWRPILRYALTVFVFGGVLPTIAATVLAMVLPAPAGRALALALMLPYVFFFVATLHISDYVSYRDVFHPGETLVPGADAGAAPPPS